MLHKIMKLFSRVDNTKLDELAVQFTKRCNELQNEVNRLQTIVASKEEELKQYRDGVRVLSVPNETFIRQLKNRVDKPTCGTSDTELCVAHRLGQQHVISVLEHWRYQCESN